MKLSEVLALPSFETATVVAGGDHLTREIAWAHVVDMPNPAPWVQPEFLLLTSGYSWPKDEATQRQQIAELAAARIGGVVMAVPNFVEHFSDTAREAAEREGVPLIEIPFEIPFARITAELHRAVTLAPYAIIERSEQIHRALTRVATRDSTLDDLARELSQLIGRSVVFEDRAQKLLASFGDHSSAPDHRFTCPIRIGTEIVGNVGIIEGAEPLNELDHRAAEHAALVAAIHIAHQRELTTTEARLGYASFLSLLDAEPGGVPLADERVRLLGFDSTERYRVGIVSIPDALPLDREGLERRDRVAQRVRETLRKAGREQLVTVSLNLVPFLLPPTLQLDTIDRALDDATLSIVIGRAHAGVDGARASYREALSLLTYRDRPRTATYDDLLVPRVITGDPSARETFLDDLFEPLRARKNGAELAAALLTLARHGFRFRQAADSLAIHPNTLRYRLDRVSEALAIDLSDADVQFRIQLAARLLDIEGRSW